MRTITVSCLILLLATAASADENTVAFERNGSRYEITCLSEGVIRVEVETPGPDAELGAYLTVPDALPPTGCEFKDGSASSSAIEVRYGGEEAPAFYDRQGKLLLKLSDQGFSQGPGEAYALEFDKEPGDRFFGLGELFSGNSFLFGTLSFVTDLYAPPLKLDQNGQKRLVTTRHLPPSELTLPFILNPRGYGLLIENPVRAEIDLQPADSFSYAAEAGPVVFYVLPGQPRRVLDLYSRLTGRTPMPPKWSMGFMQSRYGYKEEAEFRDLMQQFRSRRLPCDVLIFDLDWYSTGSGCDTMTMGNLAWEKTRFPDPEGLLDDMEQEGFKGIVILDPAVRPSSFNFEEVRDQGLVATDESGSPFIYNHWGCAGAVILDYLNPLARDWWGAKVKAIHDTGVDGWWTDKNEPEDDREEFHFGGRPSFKGHNLQALLQHKAMADMYERELPNERLFIMSRGGFVGDWRYGAGIWSGDVASSWGHLQRQVPVGLSAGLSGYGLWNSDVGGFHGTPSPELYVRWMQFGAFCPIFRAHGNHSPREPWAYGAKNEEILRGLLEVRYRLAPYFYAVLREMHETGLPPMRAMFLEFPRDLEAYDLEDQYMYGPSLLVAPVTRPLARSRSVYLPEGVWTDFWTDRQYTGPGRVRIEAPLDRIPLLVREGAIIPMMPLTQSMPDGPFGPLELHLYPGPDHVSSSYRVYDDDGRSNQYRKGDYLAREVRIDGAKTLGLSLGDPGGGIEFSTIKIHQVSRPGRITADGGEGAPAWTYDESSRLLTLTPAADEVEFRLEF